MSSLANVTSQIRTILKFLGFSAFVLVILYVLFVSGTFIKNSFFPDPVPPPEQAFGELPEVVFPSQDPLDYSFVVNTPSGNLPSFPDRMTVYKTIIDEPSLSALQNTRENVANAGFTQGETKVNDQVYQWTSRQGERIEINIINGDFEIISNYINSLPPTGLSGTVGQKESAYNFIIDFLTEMGEDTSDFNFETTKLTYLKLGQGALIEANSESDAQFVRLDLTQNPIDKYGIFYPGFTESNMYFILKSEIGIPRIVDAKFVHLIADTTAGSTYPLKTAEQAFSDLESGNALYKSEAEPGSSIDITDIALGYYLGESEQQYLLPIIIFEGPNFTGYVKAIGELTPPETNN